MGIFQMAEIVTEWHFCFVFFSSLRACFSTLSTTETQKSRPIERLALKKKRKWKISNGLMVSNFWIFATEWQDNSSILHSPTFFIMYYLSYLACGAVIWLSRKKHGFLTPINNLFLKNVNFLSNHFFRKTSKCHSVTLRSDASKTGLLTSILSSFVKRIMHQTKVSRTPSYPKKVWLRILNPESSYLGYFPKLWTNKGIWL